MERYQHEVMPRGSWFQIQPVKVFIPTCRTVKVCLCQVISRSTQGKGRLWGTGRSSVGSRFGSPRNVIVMDLFEGNWQEPMRHP